MRTALVLAAGSSRRFGRANKLLMPLGGRPVLAHAIARAKAGAHRVVVVVGHQRTRTVRIARAAGAEVAVARDHRHGLSASLRAGLRRLRPIDRELLLCLGDMPFAPVARRWRLGPAAAARPGRRGHPVLLRTAVLRSADLAGDRGLQPLLESLAVRSLAIRSGAMLDLDTRAAWRGSRGRLRAFGLS